MKLKLKTIKILDFKGIREELEVNLDQSIISGPNGWGKTTVLDAITYVFTSRMLSGLTQGWEQLDENNKLTGKSPKITLTFQWKEKDYVLEMINGQRILNGVIFPTYKSFNEYFLNLGLDFEIFHHLMNPHYILEVMDTKDARELFLSVYSLDKIIKEMKKEGLEFQTEGFYNSLEMIPNITLHLKSIKSRKLKAKTKLEVLSDQMELLNNEVSLTEDEMALQNDYEELIIQENQLAKEISVFKREKILTNECPTCKRPQNDVDEKVIKNNVKMLEELITKHEEVKTDLDSFKERYHIIKDKKAKIDAQKLIGEDVNKQIDEVLKEVEQLTQEEVDFSLFQSKRVEIIISLLKNDLPFDVKLINYNKNGGITEVFSVLSKGVDYKFLNSSKKLVMGSQLARFFQKAAGVEYPLLVDNGECLSDIQRFQDSFGPMIITRVQNED